MEGWGGGRDAGPIEVIATEGSAAFTAGLLGASVDTTSDLYQRDLKRAIETARLEEIERRILAIEAAVWPLGR